MSLAKLITEQPQFILFGGKGGVGKTTMSAASAVYVARQDSQKKNLIFTTDPAPSLADSFNQQLSHEPVQIEGLPNLWAMEIDAKKELVAFKKQYGDDILDILQEGTYLSDKETEEMFSLDIPGLDEVMGLKKIMDFMDAAESSTHQFDTYFLDTAPTGHTLRLLALPELLDNWIKMLAKLRWKYHYMVDRFSRGKEKRVENADAFLLEMKKTVKKVQTLLHDPKKTTFVVVTIPEAMGVEETKDLMEELSTYNISSKYIIINHIVPADDSSFLRTRRNVQNRYIEEIKQQFPKSEITEIELQAEEIRGMEKLTGLGEKIFSV
jgi:arsenite/tail-anchored protein-transporting ATPase